MDVNVKLLLFHDDWVSRTSDWEVCVQLGLNAPTTELTEGRPGATVIWNKEQQGSAIATARVHLVYRRRSRCRLIDGIFYCIGCINRRRVRYIYYYDLAIPSSTRQSALTSCICGPGIVPQNNSDTELQLDGSNCQNGFRSSEIQFIKLGLCGLWVKRDNSNKNYCINDGCSATGESRV